MCSDTVPAALLESLLEMLRDRPIWGITLLAERIAESFPEVTRANLDSLLSKLCYTFRNGEWPARPLCFLACLFSPRWWLVSLILRGNFQAVKCIGCVVGVLLC